MERFRLLILSGGILVILYALCACSQIGRPDTGKLTAPEYSMELTGLTAVFDNGTVMLITDSKEPIILSGDMDLSGLKTGDRITVYCDGVEETYPARTSVKEMLLKEHKSASDLPKEVMDNLAGLGYVLTGTSTETASSYTSISMEEAKEIFTEEGDCIILDVRRADEFWEGHIPGAINVANEDISDTPPDELPEKEKNIYVYCRSGRRSKEAAEKLSAMGYTAVIEIGGILDWTGEIEK